jgi:predicted N-formylglutamate amidohydrolase
MTSKFHPIWKKKNAPVVVRILKNEEQRRVAVVTDAASEQKKYIIRFLP